MPLIEVDGLTVRYPRAAERVLDGFNMRLQRGETLLLMGVSGGGKSTVGLCLAGLIPASVPAVMTGTISFDGRPADDLPVSERTARLGIVFQDPETQFCMLTIEDEVAFGLENMVVPRVEMDGRIREALDLVGLSHRRQERLDRLSGGQKQRLALACVLARRPDVLFLDEPTSNLDPAARHAFYRTLHALRARQPELAMVIVEHVLDDLIDTVDRVLVLDGGRALIDGPPADVFDRHDRDLDALGVWLPQVTALGLKLRDAGLTLPRLPLTVDDAADVYAPLLHADAIEPPRGIALNGKDSVPAISIRHLSFGYDTGAEVLHDVSLDVPAGSMFTLLGANGSGKTTLAGHLVDILPARPGQVTLLGDDLTALTTTQRADRIGYVFQNPEHQFVAATVEDELAYSLRVRGRPDAEIAATVDRLLQEFGLAALRAINPFKPSQGQKRRLSVATMLALGQRVLVLDEPTFGQDRTTAHAIMSRLDDLRRRGVTVFTITHDMQMVADYGQRVAVLVEGRVRYVGTPADLFSRADLLAEASLRPLALHDLARRLGVAYSDGTLPLSLRDWLPFFGVGRAWPSDRAGLEPGAPGGILS